jgi:hypothetical protein
MRAGAGFGERLADRVRAGSDGLLQAAEEFFGFPPQVFIGYAGRGHAEVLFLVGDVCPGECAEPLEVPVHRLKRGVAALAVFAGVILVVRCCHGGVLSLDVCGWPACHVVVQDDKARFTGHGKARRSKASAIKIIKAIPECVERPGRAGATLSTAWSSSSAWSSSTAWSSRRATVQEGTTGRRVPTCAPLTPQPGAQPDHRALDGGHVVQRR